MNLSKNLLTYTNTSTYYIFVKYINLRSDSFYVISAIESLENPDKFQICLEWKLLSRQVNEVFPLPVPVQGFHTGYLRLHDRPVAPADIQAIFQHLATRKDDLMG